MKQPRMKGQALALVLIVIVVAVVIAFAITNRVVQDIKQQGEEKASTRAETLSESAVENLTLKIQSGNLETAKPAANAAESWKFFAISNQSPDNTSYQTLDLCSQDSTTDISKQCDKNSVAQVNYYKSIVQFKLFDNESIEAFMVEPEAIDGKSGTGSNVLIHIKGNDSYTDSSSKLLVKAFERVNTGTASAPKPELRVVGECLIGLTASTATCLPTTLSISSIQCPTNVPVDANPADTTPGITTSLVGDGPSACFSVTATGTNKVSTYRIKPILTTDKSEVPYLDISVTGNAAADYKLPVYQMAMITAGVYSGTSGSDQQVFQQSTRLVLLNKSVSEVGDYVLYNGSEQPIKKCKTSNDPNATCN